MKRPTYEELRTDRDRLSRENTIYFLALNLALAGKPDAVERVRGSEPGEHHTLRLYGATGAHGGILLITFRVPGQKDHTDAHYFDDYHTAYGHSRFPRSRFANQLAAALERLRVRRDAIVHAEIAGAPCAASLGCLCAGHASGLPADAPCDTNEDAARARVAAGEAEMGR